MKSLVLTAGLGKNAGLDGTKVVLSGCSAGSRGAMLNTDYIPGILEAAGVSGAQVYGFFDSPLWIDLAPMKPQIMSLMEQTQYIFGVINSTRLARASGGHWATAGGGSALGSRLD